jgi:photosystem II stability/assembly factor-like uncharacterized protein
LEFPDALSHVVSFAYTDNEHSWILTSYDAAMGQELVGIFQTTDGGLSWNTVSETPLEYNGKSDRVPFEGIKQGIYFKDAQNGWLTGETHGNVVWLYSTHDGGRTWAPQNIPIPQGVSADGGAASSRTPVFFDDKEGILPVQYRGDSLVMYFYQTRDGGHTWSPISKLPLDPETMDVAWAFADAGHGFAISGGRLWISADGGITWSLSENGEMKFTRARLLNFPDIATGFLMSDDSLMKTSDGGKTWSRLTSTVGTSQVTPQNSPKPADNFKPDISQSFKLNNLFGWRYCQLSPSMPIFIGRGGFVQRQVLRVVSDRKGTVDRPVHRLRQTARTMAAGAWACRPGQRNCQEASES